MGLTLSEKKVRYQTSSKELLQRTFFFIFLLESEEKRFLENQIDEKVARAKLYRLPYFRKFLSNPLTVHKAHYKS